MESQQDLIEAAQRGSNAAFERLIIDLERQMLSLAAGLASFPDEADDIYQEAVLQAYTALPKFRSQSQFSTWLYRIFVNTALGYKRKLSHKFSRQVEPQGELSAPTEHYRNPQGELENSQLSRSISRALAQLSMQERVAFVLCHQQELAISEAAQVMECGEGSVKSYLFRAREKLRKHLQEYQR